MKNFISIAALIPFIGIAIFYFVTPGIEGPPQNPRTDQRTSQAVPNGKLSESDKAKKAYVAMKRKEAAALFAKADEHFARANELAARNWSPDNQLEAVNAKMRLREPAYMELFRAWGLDSAMRDTVLRLIREREVQLMRVKGGFLKREYGASEYHAGKLVEETLAETKLTEVLDQKQYQELVKLEVQLTNDAITQGQALLNSHKKP